MSDIVVNGQLVSVPCRKCWRCRSNRVNDWVGRCIAESRISDYTLSITLTYSGSDVPEASVLTYSDFQKFIKRLRKDGYSVRYMVAGEYGTKKGRAHWHAILFFTGLCPKIVDVRSISPSVLRLNPSGTSLVPSSDIALSERFLWSYWPHGISFLEEPSYSAFRYCLKYVLKQETKGISVSKVSLSKKPPLGDLYFKKLAIAHVEQGLSPSNFMYSFPDCRDASGVLHKFYLQGTSRDNFIQYFIDQWSLKHDFEFSGNKVVLDWMEGQDFSTAEDLDNKFVSDFNNSRRYSIWSGLVEAAMPTPSRIIVYSSGHTLYKTIYGKWFFRFTNDLGGLEWEKEVKIKEEPLRRV